MQLNGIYLNNGIRNQKEEPSFIFDNLKVLQVVTFCPLFSCMVFIS